jgi:hypothetical protein
MPLSALAASGMLAPIRKISGNSSFRAGMIPRLVLGIFISGIDWCAIFGRTAARAPTS